MAQHAGLTVRAATAAEFAAIGELSFRSYAQLFPDGVGGVAFADSPYAQSVRDVSSRSERAEIIVAARPSEDGSGAPQVVGTLDYHANYNESGLPGFGKLAVDVGMQKQGIAELLIRWCMERGGREGHPFLLLHTSDHMPAAQRLYRRLGFVRRPAMDFTAPSGTAVMGFELALFTIRPENAVLEAWLAQEAPEPVLEPGLDIVDAHQHFWDWRTVHVPGANPGIALDYDPNVFEQKVTPPAPPRTTHMPPFITPVGQMR
jgi:GNAT superfamily N-acetyltransferase